jgi:F0F1-type ATP synthase membrane subunit c/vacuolar-type H+-ATPase subunit K
MLLLAAIPVLGIRLANTRMAGKPLMVLRAVFLSFSGALLLFAIVLSVLSGQPNGPVVPWVPILAVIAVASLFGVRVSTSKPLDCTSATTLATTYRTRFFLVIAFSESVALFAFVFTFIGGPRWIYDVGGAFALFRFWTVAPPTKAGLRRDQDRLTAAGCGVSLVSALQQTPPEPRGWGDR